MNELTTVEHTRNNGVLRLLSEFVRGTEVKRLINQIINAQNRNNFRTLVVLSEFSGEGKTFFTAAMALSYARFLANSVLIVNTIPQQGQGDTLLRAIVGRHSSSTIKGANGRIDLITARTDGVGKFDSPDFQVAYYIDRFANNYDLVLIDTCAMSMNDSKYIDPVIVARYAEASVLITSNRSVERTTARRIVQKLNRYGIRPLGTVYNSGATNRWMSRQ
jgi:Mrp family chromosome partitioning ATPase